MHARASGLGSELLARLAALEASALAQRGGLVEWAPGMEQPLLSRSEAVKKPPSVRTRRSLLSLTRLWWLWVDKADIEVEDGRPSWEQADAFVCYMANSRRQRSLMLDERRGLGATEVELFTVLLHRHVLPTLYPQLVDEASGGMGKGQYRAWCADLRASARMIFTEGAMEQLAESERSKAHAAVIAAGGAVEAAGSLEIRTRNLRPPLLWVQGV